MSPAAARGAVYQVALNRGSEKRGRVSAERLAGAWGQGPGGSARARPRVETRAGWGAVASAAAAKARCPCWRPPCSWSTLGFGAARHLATVSSRRGCSRVLSCSPFRRRGRGGSERAAGLEASLQPAQWRSPRGAAARAVAIRGGPAPGFPIPHPGLGDKHCPVGFLARGPARRGPGS